ncbi:LysR family transcriptional regulator [Caldimonas sp. KR1-144]|uniref:LysR family transcriptional regulator n=1 Tax=Caldimonas sp. KR1-144 TaxID=3400911 RepID=UPI003C0743F7
MDQLRAMRVFASVIESGSFVGAAQALQLSPAVVTRLVAELEDHLGARLINRTTRRLALTEIGEAYLERARQILTEVEEAEALATQAAREPSGQVRVLSPPAFAVHQLAKHLPRFRARYPKVTIDLTVPGAVQAVDEAYDVSILMLGEAPRDADVIVRRLARTEFVVCAAPEYLDRRGRPQHPRELAGHDSLVPRSGGRASEVFFQREVNGQVERIGLTPSQPALSTLHVDTHYAAALAGLGIAGLPSFVIEDALLENALERVLSEWRMFTMTIYAGLPTRKHIPARTRAFVDFLIETFGGEDRDPWLAAAGCETALPVSAQRERAARE